MQFYLTITHERGRRMDATARVLLILAGGAQAQVLLPVVPPVAADTTHMCENPASIVHTELCDESPWYGTGASTIATGVGALRMINEKHWTSDVFAGTGFGIMSAHPAYLTHRNRRGRKAIGRDVGRVRRCTRPVPHLAAQIAGRGAGRVVGYSGA